MAKVVRGANFIFTGEGATDRQTLMGKTLSGVVRTAVGVPIAAFAESLDEGVEEPYSHSFASLVSIVTDVTTLEEALADGHEALVDAAERAVRLSLAGAARDTDLL